MGQLSVNDKTLTVGDKKYNIETLKSNNFKIKSLSSEIIDLCDSVLLEFEFPNTFSNHNIHQSTIVFIFLNYILL